MTKRHKQISLSLSLSLSLLVCSIFAFALPARAQVSSNLEGVSWNTDYTECTISTVVNGPDLRTEFESHNGTVEVITFNSGAGVTGSTSELFSGLRALKDIKGAFTCTDSTNMNKMFSDCLRLESVDLSGFNTSQVTDMSGMFTWCSNLSSLNLSGFNTSQVTDMSGMFTDCLKLTSLNVRGFDTSRVVDMHDMFYECSSLTSLDISFFDTSQVRDMSNMFDACVKLASLDVSNFDTSKVKDMSGMFSLGGKNLTGSNLARLDVSGFDTSQVTNMSNMFGGCSNLAQLDVSGFNTVCVTDMSKMFTFCKNLTELDLSHFNTSAVQDLGNMFANCSSLTSLDLSSFDTRQVINTERMFVDCSSLSSLDISSFNTAKVQTMIMMFFGCESLTRLVLPKTFVTTSVYPDSESAMMTTTGMFASCTSLTYLDLGGITTKDMYGDHVVGAFSAAFASFHEGETEEDTKVLGILPNLSTIVCQDGCLFDGSDLSHFPVPIDEISGSYFNYPAYNNKGWNAYDESGNQVASGMTTQDEFATCQAEHPSTLMYVWVDGPQPEPTPSDEGWQWDENGWQYYDENGDLVHGWLNLDGAWYYFDEAGYAVHDMWLWNEDFGPHWYYFWSDCSMASNAWLWDGAWYWVCSTGPMIQGIWQWIDNAWYGFWWNGTMCQGWVWDSDYVAWFYCYDNGAMATNTWVDGCYLNNNGIWVH